MNENITFEQYVDALVGTKIVIETMEGVVRRGKLTKVVKRAIKVSKDTSFSHPESLYLDNDPGDAVLIRRLVRLERDPLAK